MVDPAKTIRMTELAKLDSGMTGKQLTVASYRKRDYMLRQMLLSFLAGTLCYPALLIIWTVAMWDQMGAFIGGSSVSHGVSLIILGYVIFVAAYLCLTWFVSSRKYTQACVVRDQYRKELDLLLTPDREED